ARRLGTPAKHLSSPALERLRAHDWPGNVRELENLCWRLAALAPGDNIGVADLGPLAGAGAAGPAGAGWEDALADWARARLAADAEGLHADAVARLERVLLDAALEASGGHRGEAAAKLGLGRNTVTRKLGSSRRRQ